MHHHAGARPIKKRSPLAPMRPKNPYPSPPFLALSVLKRCVPKTLAFAFGLRLRSKTRCFKTRVSGRRLPNGKPRERLRFRALRSKTSVQKTHCDHFWRFKDFPWGQSLRLGPLRSKNAAFCVCVLKPTKFLRVLSATFILSKNSRIFDAKSRQTSANLG